MFTFGEKCVKYLMFVFNLIFVICAIGLMVAGGIAQSHYDYYSVVLNNTTVSGPALIITVGVFLFIISFLGCCGAAKESYGMLMAYSVLVGIILILQMAGGIAALAQKSNIEEKIKPDLEMFVGNYHNQTNKEINNVIDFLQSFELCCGANDFRDYKELIGNTNSTIPASCCRDPDQKCARTTDDLKNCSLADDGAKDCPIHTKGCKDEMTNILATAIEAAGGAAIGLAFVELVGVILACFLARRIKNGFA